MKTPAECGIVVKSFRREDSKRALCSWQGTPKVEKTPAMVLRADFSRATTEEVVEKGRAEGGRLGIYVETQQQEQVGLSSIDKEEGDGHTR